MKTKEAIRLSPPAALQQRGSALFIAVILLLLASVITLLALNVGIFEQRTSGNDARAKIIAEVAEGGIAQGAEFFRLRPDQLAAASGRWVLCGATDTTFPCGSIPDVLVDADGDPATAGTVQRRSTMYYWCNAGAAPCNTGAADLNNDGLTNLFDARMLPLPDVLPGNDGRIMDVGGFDTVSYGVGAVLCRIAIPKSDTDITRCATVPAEQSTTNVYNFVSVASLPGEGTRTTVSQMLGQYQIFNAAPNKPPIVAAGSVDLVGTLQIVTNPDAGGPGVPVSVWTRKDMAAGGTPDTCYFDEFIRYGAQKSKPPVMEDDIMITCDSCSCSGHALSATHGNALDEDMDILDVDGSNGSNNLGVNADVKLNNDETLSEFPCDLFEYMFQVNAWDDVSPDDGFCETKVMATYTNSENNFSATIGADEKYLYTNADTILVDPDDADAAKLAKTAQKQLPALFPDKAYKNIVWCQAGCTIGSGKQLGTPEFPVLLVVDGPMKIQGRVFGVVFVRATESTLDAGTGGSATLDMNAGAAVYGSIVVQGQISKANGTAAVIYSSEVFRRLAGNLPPKNSNLPGAWTDRLSY